MRPRHLITGIGVSTALAGGAHAADLNVAADIAPVHSLVSMVTEGLGTPALLIDPNASPHTNAMRPSAAAALETADAVFWVGPELTPWLDGPLTSLSSDAIRVPLLDTDGTTRLAFRESDAFGAHGHGEGHAEHEAADHDHTHDHDATDPHAWLDPNNASVWLTRIAEVLSDLDPDNAARYAANADEAKARIAAEVEDAQDMLAPLAERNFIVFHDAYHYFEARFGIEATGALSLSDAVPPGPARVAEIRSDITDASVVCVFSEPQFSYGLVTTITDGTDVKTALLDPLGSGFEPGPDLYPSLIRDMATQFRDCLQ